MSRTLSPLLLPLAFATLAGCTQFPELDHTRPLAGDDVGFPALVPVEPLLAQATAGRIDPARTQTGLEGRVARLQARAARLRGSVLSGSARQRLAQGLR